MNRRISILTPCFNSAATIERAIHSVQLQGHDNVEHIVVDGASTDGTVDILKRYPHLRWISEPDQGQSDAMNKAMRMATGDVMTFLNADDEFFAGAFACADRLFDQSPHADMVIGRYELRKATCNVVVKPRLVPESVVGGIGDWPGNPVSYFYKADLQNRIGPFPKENHYTMDFWWMLRALSLATPVYSDEVFGCFHCYGDNKSSDRENVIRCRKLELMKYMLSIRGVKHVPIWLKTRYWHYLYRQRLKSERLGGTS